MLTIVHLKYAKFILSIICGENRTWLRTSLVCGKEMKPFYLFSEVTQAPEGIRTHTRKGQAEAGYTQGSQRFAGTMSHKVTCS